ncbi:MAG TPA: right-handed parallel beta-helix repeat-containing protein, partial [Candidatus Absconditabacterales bacterium]|nr:right-handed parallel beta-helix repeat-containing protein [Candidatus Absconditabacterales bacterium]
IAFEGANITALEIITSNNFVVSGCDIKFGGKDGIDIKAGSNNTSIINTVFEDIHNNSLYCATRQGVASGLTIRGNTFNRSALIPGMGGDGDISGIAAYVGCDNSLVENNVIYQAGFNGIHFDRPNSIIRKNYINQTNSIKYDGAGIYTWQSTYKGYTGMKIQDNIIVNSVGANEGTNNPNHRLAHGIYIDDWSEGIEIKGNTCVGNMGAGIKIGSSIRDIDMSSGNTLYNNIYQYHISRHISGYANMDIGNSILVSLSTGQYNYRIEATIPFSGNMNLLDDWIQNMGTINNNYRASTSGSYNVVIAYQPNYLYKTFSQWKSYSNLDNNSTEYSIDNTGNILFEYNSGNTNRIISLSGIYTDMYGNIQSGNIVILPYSSTVLVKYFDILNVIPEISQAYIYSGTTGNNGSTG